MQLNNSLTPVWFTPASEKDQPAGVSFLLKPLSGLAYADVTAGSFVGEDGQVRYDGRALRACLTHGVIGWRGFREADGTEIPFSPAALERLYYNVMVELFREILTISEFSEAARKN